MKVSVILSTACTTSVLAAPVLDSRAQGEPNLLGGFTLLGAPGQEAFNTFASFLDNFFNGVIISPGGKVLQGKPVDAVRDAVQGLFGTASNAVTNVGKVGAGAINGYNPTAQSEVQKAKGAAAAGVDINQYEASQRTASDKAAAENPLSRLLGGLGLPGVGQTQQGNQEQSTQAAAQAAQASQAQDGKAQDTQGQRQDAGDAQAAAQAAQAQVGWAQADQSNGDQAKVSQR